MGRLIRGGVACDDPGEGVLANLRYTLQLLAAEPQDQIEHFLPPGFPLAAEEMAEDFDNWSKAVGHYWPLTADQSGRLKALDRFLDDMSGEDNAHLWTLEALADACQWDDVRALAKLALTAFGWSVEVPPREEYVDAPDEESRDQQPNDP